VVQVQAAHQPDSAIADRTQDYRNRLALAYQAAGRPADAEPLLQQLLDAEPGEGVRLDLLTRLGSVQVPMLHDVSDACLRLNLTCP